MRKLLPINLKKWIDENRALLKPPVGNQVLWEDADFIVMVVAGPNTRNDFHVGPTEELFYQVEGDICLRVIENAKFSDIIIKEGDLFLLPAKMPHCPTRGKNTIGLVVEQKRKQGTQDTQDTFQWYCEKCQNKLYEESIFLTDIVKQLPVVFSHFLNSEKNRTCQKCGFVAASVAKEN